METIFSCQGCQELHDHTEVTFFPSPHAMASNNNIRISLKITVKVFPEMKFMIVPAFIKPDYLQNLADSIKGHPEVMTMIIFFIFTTEFQSVTSQKTDTKPRQIDGSCCNTRRHTSFATVISVTKRQSKLSNY
jgi:ferrochelatase